uniref:RanBP2-type domain-containing protein n=1 Tax=Pygocentrus nattereri TaxID=42514 RepID=A0AAR2J8U7_PYGNA
MGDKKSPTRPKRQAKPTADDRYWDCSVCTFRNSAEAFKCSICDVRKGTSTRYGILTLSAWCSPRGTLFHSTVHVYLALVLVLVLVASFGQF